MQRPAVIELHERPALAPQSAVFGIVLDIADGSAHVGGMVEEHLPTALRPDWMIRIAPPQFDNGLARGLLKDFDHLFRFVLVLAQKDVNMIRHDRTGVTGVALFVDGPAYSLGNNS